MNPPRYLPRFLLERTPALTSTRYRVRGVDEAGRAGDLLALGRRRRLSRHEQVDFVAPQGPAVALFSIRARAGAPGQGRFEYDVFDARGEAIGYFRRESRRPAASYHLSAPYLDAEGGRRRRRVEFDDHGHQVLRVDRERGLRHRYLVIVPDRRVDLRIAASVAVALDAFGTR